MRVAVVTGGASGIGAATCRRLVLDGFDVVVADIDEVGAKEVAAEIGGEALSLDVTDGDAVRSALGERVVDVLVNNAGGDRIAFFLDTTPAEWDWVLALNLKGTSCLIGTAVLNKQAQEVVYKSARNIAGVDAGCDQPLPDGDLEAQSGTVRRDRESQ